MILEILTLQLEFCIQYRDRAKALRSDFAGKIPCDIVLYWRYVICVHQG